MAHGSARIESPEVIQQFRNHFVDFDRVCRQAVSEAQGDIQNTSEWLQREQLFYWKRELRKRDEAFQKARLEYERARRETLHSGRSTAVDAKVAFEKARRLKEEAETKLQAVKKWTVLLEHSAHEFIGPCLALSTQLGALTPRALARLDKMVQSLEAYLRDMAASAPKE
ncbi:MAG: hypothetical protein FJ279_20325 [Planctomycetes bacterium]|nr:hypothetical protein [Planctomycetota bacterium]